jgi:predicted transcriptional regulator
MALDPLPKPTDAELEILSIIWKLGATTVRQVHEELRQSRDVGYTTVLKLMQIMHDKRLLTRDDSQRSHVYQARQKEQVTQKQLIVDLLAKAFGGSTEKLVLQALSASRATKEELAEIRQLIHQLEGGKK